MEPWTRGPLPPGQTNDWSFADHIYTNLGYNLVGDTAVLPPKVNPFLFGKPSWAK